MVGVFATISLNVKKPCSPPVSVLLLNTDAVLNLKVVVA